jgi:hypothetical protein
MRETCARVLAAALMTGAIGFALAMPAIFATAHNAGRSLTAPPSFLQRSVHVVASAPSRSARGGRLEETLPIGPASLLQSGRSGSTPSGSTPGSGRYSTRAGRSERAPKPAPKPTPAPLTPPARELASTAPQAAVSSSPPTQPAATPDSKGKGKKKGKQHNKNKGKPTEVSQPPVAAASPEPANEPAATEPEKEHGNGNGNDKGKDKGKSDGKGHNG